MEADPSDVIRSPGPWPERAGYDPAAQMTVNPAEYVTELFRAHHLELVRLAVLMVGDLATAEDVVQDAFEQLHRRWRTLRKQSSALDLRAVGRAERQPVRAPPPVGRPQAGGPDLRVPS